MKSVLSLPLLIPYYGTAAFPSVTLQTIPRRDDRYQTGRPPQHEPHSPDPWPLDRNAQIRQKPTIVRNHRRLLLSARRNSNGADDDVLGDAVDSVISFVSTPVPIAVLPGPPLPLVYILALAASAVLLPGSNTVLLIGFSVFFAFFLALGRVLVFGDPLEEDESEDDDDDDATATEAAMVDLVALGGSILSAYLLIPPDLVVPPPPSDGGSAPILAGLGVLLLSVAAGVLSANGRAADPPREEGDGSETDGGGPSRRLMDLWDEKLGEDGSE